MKFRITENKRAIILSIFLFLLLSWITFISEGVWGGADNYQHYNFSRYSFRHPEFFLDHWAKPLFTLLSSPFAQFGFIGVRFFNILLAVLTGFFCYRITSKLEYRNPSLVIIFNICMPVFLIMSMSGMTEILFAFLIVFSVWIFLESKYSWAAFVISFLPFARTEGIIILPCFFLAFCYLKRFREIFFLASGTILYSIVGGFYYNDFFWVVTKTPYGDAKAIYGSGGLWDFITAYPEITGGALAILLVAGLVSLFVKATQRNRKATHMIELLLIALPFLLYVFFHSFLWWKGMGGSLGLIRVMAGVTPLAAILCLRGWNLSEPQLSRIPWLKKSIVSALVIFLGFYAGTFYQLPVEYTGPEKVVKQASLWLKATGNIENKMYYHDPFFIQMLELDPTDPSRIEQYLPDKKHPENGIPVGSLILWDAHFSPNEGEVPLENLSGNEHFTMIERFIPHIPFISMKRYSYEVRIYKKTK